MKNPIYPCLWFNGQAKEAAVFYCSVFENSKIMTENPMVVTANLNGKQFMFLNGGPDFSFTEAVSFVIDCETQADIDYYWEKLTSEGTESMCGWLKDKYGISWQVVPTILPKLLSDPAKAARVMPVFMTMRKFDIEQLMNA